MTASSLFSRTADLAARETNRRNVLKFAALGLAAPLFGSALSACGSGGSDTAAAVDLKGKNLQLTVLGVAGWPPSAMITELGNAGFAGYAKKDLGYDIKFTGDSAPFGQLFQKAATSLATRSQEYNLVVSDSQWLGAFAGPKWTIPFNDIISANKELDIEWYSDIVVDGYMKYPEGADTIYGLPQEGDVMVMYVRKDMLTDSAEKEAFKSKYGRDLPQTFEDFENLTWTAYADVMAHFTRPEANLYGMGMQYSKEYDDFSCYFYPFLFSRGYEIWDAKSHNVQGILNTDDNAKALDEFLALRQYCPPGANQVGIPELADLFTQGKVFSCIQWAAMGPSMIPANFKDKVIVVPPPAFEVDGQIKRTYTLGGQSWVINAFNDDENKAAIVDFLKYWYSPAVQLEFAKKGGNPCDKATLESAGFDDLQPWFRAYKYMLKDGRTKDFWHDPNYAKMLSDQQEAFSAYATGQANDPKAVLDYIAYKQQETLHNAGQTDKAPEGSLPKI